MEEVWKDIVGYEGKYQVSNLGRVKSLNYKQTNSERILKENTDKKGYKRAHLFKNGKGVHISIHRLVAEAFIPNPNNYPQVNHKDENKANNNMENLEWCTNEYNHNYGTRNKRMGNSLKGQRIYDNHPMARGVKCITTGEIFTTIKEAQEKYNTKHISDCCRGKMKTSGKLKDGTKLIWEYIE